MKTEEIAELQRAFCALHSSEFLGCGPLEIAGYAKKTTGLTPLDGLRHNAGEQTSGWYLWCGEVFSEEPDFFEPTHAAHFYERYPEIVKLLGLAPGSRFLLAGDFLDIWFDERLLD